MPDQEVVLGKTYTDRVTGYKGIAVVRSIWLEGCARIGLQGKVDKDGNIPDTMTFDEPQLFPKKPTPKKKPGGPHGSDPQSQY